MKNGIIISSPMELQTQGWYRYLIEDCQAIIGQRVFNSRLELIYGYGEVGERIITDKQYKKFAHGNKDFLKGVFSSIGLSAKRGYITIELYEYVLGEYNKRFSEPRTFEEMFELIGDIFQEGKNISLNKIETKYLRSKENDRKTTDGPNGTATVHTAPDSGLSVDKLKKYIDKEILDIQKLNTNFISKDDVIHKLRMLRHEFCGSLGLG